MFDVLLLIELLVRTSRVWIADAFEFEVELLPISFASDWWSIWSAQALMISLGLLE